MSNDDKKYGGESADQAADDRSSKNNGWSNEDELYDNYGDSDRDSDFGALFSEEDDEYEQEDNDHPSQDFDPAPLRGDKLSLFNKPLDAPEQEWEEEGYIDEDDEDSAEEDRIVTLPLGLILVGVIALILLGAGGYGVMQQRASMEEEIRNLQASLANANSQGLQQQSRSPSEEIRQRNELLTEQVLELERENSSLAAIVAGLESQLEAQQVARKQTASPATASKPEPKPSPAPTSTPSNTKPAPAVASDTGAWFVNFASYSKEDTAKSWVSRLQPASGKVVVIPGQSNGTTIYRVRIINIANKSTAQATARALEQEYGLPKLWVGESD